MWSFGCLLVGLGETSLVGLLGLVETPLFGERMTMLPVLCDSADLHDRSLSQHSHQSTFLSVVLEHLAPCP